MDAQQVSNGMRRSRTDLRYLAYGGDGSKPRHAPPVTANPYDDAKRNTRLIAHGWLTSQGRLTGWGYEIAGVVRHLIDRNEFDMVIDIMGMSDFIATCKHSRDPVGYIEGVLLAVNRGDEASGQVKQRSGDLIGDLGPSLTFEPAEGVVVATWEVSAAANEFAREWAPDHWEVEQAHDERFSGNRNPRRLRLTVVGDDE